MSGDTAQGRIGIVRYVIAKNVPVKDYIPGRGYVLSQNPGNRTARKVILGKSDNLSAAFDMAIGWLAEIDPTDVVTVTLRSGLPWRSGRVVFQAYGTHSRGRWSL